MFSKEDLTPNNDPHIKQLRDDFGCMITQTQGVMWEKFLQYIFPTFVSNYDHIALVLYDMFIPDQVLHVVDVDKMIKICLNIIFRLCLQEKWGILGNQ